MASLRSSLLRQYVRWEKAHTNRAEPVPVQRAKLEKAARLMLLPRGVDVQPVTVEHLPAEWITPRKLAGRQVILYLHGGGYALCSLATHRAFAARIALASASRLLLLDYRLAPEHPYPAAVEDAIAAYCWLLQQGIAPHEITLMGDSAGGGLVLATLLALRDSGTALPAQAVCLSPLTDMTGSGESMTTRAAVDPMNKPADAVLFKHYIGTSDPRLPYLSPLFGDLHGLPPLLIHAGDHEVMLSDATRFAEKAQAAGVDVTLKIWPEMWHIFQFFAPLIPEANQAIREIGTFIQQK